MIRVQLITTNLRKQNIVRLVIPRYRVLIGSHDSSTWLEELRRERSIAILSRNGNSFSPLLSFSRLVCLSRYTSRIPPSSLIPFHLILRVAVALYQSGPRPNLHRTLSTSLLASVNRSSDKPHELSAGEGHARARSRNRLLDFTSSRATCERSSRSLKQGEKSKTVLCSRAILLIARITLLDLIGLITAQTNRYINCTAGR